MNLAAIIRKRLDYLESMQDYEVSTDTVRCWIDQYEDDIKVFISGELNIKPLSVNEAYTGRRYKTDPCRQYSKSVGWLLKQAVIPQVKYEICITWFFSSEASDVDNPAKIFIDQLQKKYRFNDKQVYKLVLEKRIVNQGQEKIKYEIKEYRD